LTTERKIEYKLNGILVSRNHRTATSMKISEKIHLSKTEEIPVYKVNLMIEHERQEI